jgi:endoglucanase
MSRRNVRNRLVAIAGVLACSLGLTNVETTQILVPADYVSGAWLLYHDKYVSSDGRIIDTRANGISHSEGQGYGMLLAVSADDRRSFDRIWAWTKVNLYVRGDGLAAWRWDPASTPHITDENNATDGDLLIAWALSLAAQKWKSGGYREAAQAIAAAIAKNAVIDSPYGKILLPGVHGFAGKDQPDGPIVNLSYWVFPAIRDLGLVSAAFPADELIKTGLKLTRDARFGPAALPSDWISLASATPVPAQNYPAQFGHDAIRVPLYLAWYSRDYPDVLAEFEKSWRGAREPSVAVVELATATPIAGMADPGYVAVADLVSCSLGSEKTADRAAAFQTTDYYPSTLHLLSLIALAERYPLCLPDLQ